MPKARTSPPKAPNPVPKARFFYALRPDPAAADELAALARDVAARWGGHAFSAQDIHLTLAFVGLRPLEDQPALEAILHGLPVRIETRGTSSPGSPGGDRSAPEDANGDRPRDVLALSRLGCFGHGVLWIGPPSHPREAAPAAGTFAHRLADAIRERLRAAQIDFDDRPLKLHATLVRGGAQAFGRQASADETDVPATPPGGIVPDAWSVVLGASASDSTPQRRYRWWRSALGRADPT